MLFLVKSCRVALMIGSVLILGMSMGVDGE